MSVFNMPGAYDRAITVFSPEGRLFQVEYALETVYKGSTIIGISCPEGVIIGAEEKLESELQDPEFTQKIYKVDDHIGAAVVGLSSDARILIDEARVFAQSNRLMYNEPIDVEMMAKRIGDVKQIYTQHAGVRPFGVSIIFGGVDRKGSRLLRTDPSGSYRTYKAVAVGMGREAAENLLKKEYNDKMSLQESINLAIKCLLKSTQDTKELRIRMASIRSDTKYFKNIPEDELKKILDQMVVEMDG